MVTKALVLAAGRGTRMNSGVPKMLQPLGGWPLIRWSVEACRLAVGEAPYVVIPSEAEQLRNAAGGEAVFIVQAEPLGTGDAVSQAAKVLNGNSELLIVTNADMPLLTAASLNQLVRAQQANSGPLTLLIAESEQPRGFGRIARDASGRIIGIIEEAEASPEQLALTELNLGAFCFRAEWLWQQLPRIPKSP
ncbi:MAG TPA: NTP transferase domain-containing protein, partial [Anaerolineales bacterium]|nr:NTP transferase domain-containing protein [Anaerolineales bacterium]